MKHYRGIVLTDHRAHSDQNSVYALTAALAKHPQVEQLYVASRYNAQNNGFFEHHKTTVVHAMEATPDFGFDPTGQQFLANTTLVDLEKIDFIFLRLPRPISDAFLDYLLDALPQTVFINHPKGIQTTSSKAFLTEFEQWCPPIQLCHSAEEVEAFAQRFPIVLKPLREYGGKGIVRIENEQVHAGGDEPLQPLKEYLASIEPNLTAEGYLAMQFLKNVDQGDKRILVVGGHIMGSSLRLPAKGSWLCNVAQGGYSVPAGLSPEEELMVQDIAPRLLMEGVLVFGMDTLVGDDGKRVLSEINTLSIGGFPQAEAQLGKPIVALTADAIVQHIHKTHQHA